MAKHFYFTLSHGLRGCYMPDADPQTIMVKTRRELKEAIASELFGMEDDMVGLSKKNIAAFAALCWREAHKDKPAYLPHCLPCHDRSVKIAKHSYGIFCSVASRAEYLEAQREAEAV